MASRALLNIAYSYGHGLNRHNHAKPAAFDVEVWRHMVICVNRNLAVGEATDGRHEGFA
jgi:hypothetical protein